MTKDLQKLISIIKSKALTEESKVEQIQTILDEDPELVHTRISDDILSSVTSKYSICKNNITLLHVAARWNCVEAARFLIEEGADVNATSDDEFQNTPLHEAADYGSTEVAELLLKHGANIESKDHFGNTPLHKASNRGCEEVVKLLLDKGADADAVDDGRRTPLHKAITNSNRDNYLNIVKMLLDYGANTEIEDQNNGTPLYHAASSVQIKAIKLLLTRADVNARNKRGDTPLHIVVNGGLDNLSKEVCEVAKLLLNRGADVHAKNENGNTPLHNAAFYRSEGVARLFLEYGANINETNNYGITPLKWAICGELSLPIHSQPDREPIVRFFIEQTLAKSPLTKPDFLKKTENSTYWKEAKHSTYWDKCTTEIEEMQKYTIGNMSKKKVSLYDFFAENDSNQLASYMNNKDIVETLNANDYKEKFPIFASKIEYQVQKGVERKCALDPAKNYFSKARLSSTIPVVQEKFNEYIFQEIFKYADNALLKEILLRRDGLTNIKGAQNSTAPGRPVEDDTISSRFSGIRLEEHGKCVTQQNKT